MADDTEQAPIVLHYTPANEGDFVHGIPARDLTEADVEEAKAREPAAFANATTPHPTTGKALYTDAAAPKSRSKQAGKADAEDKE